MAYNASGVWSPEDDSVASGVSKLTSQSSPLMQQATTQANQISNRRGLLNSSMATGAGVQAGLNAAIPIATQDASTAAAKNLSAQNQTQNLAIQTNDLAAKKQATAQQIAQQDRQYAQSALAAAQQNYDTAFMNIAKESALPAANRDAYLSHLGAMRDSDLNLVEQMYGIDLQWGTTGGGSDTTSTKLDTANPNPLIQTSAF